MKDEESISPARPLFIWIFSIFLILFGVMAAARVVSSMVLDKDAATQHPVFLIVPLILLILGLGLFTGRRLSLILVKVLWILWLILLLISLLAAGISGSPDWSHALGIFLVILTAIVWSEKVKLFCNKSITGHTKYRES